ncbi:endonuclease/exonuclease/phosphatase family protein [Plantactinospora sp. KBS50]|uniref:endonuclease/exonuclease/phosphatase family protein n=1 Tax=Plantactinospora sp. KBS50 TaxID=2024580 RepID=UPI000BAACD6B|nr:endonuclease/exonuclease/phosphatase family protein [Plantactinospora sp. KBS50]ASW57565.1 endonuclease [Plantactinospora sp. KBS50]
MTWNIKTGGRDGADTGRLDRVIRVAAEAAPDVLALQELRGFGRAGRLARLATALGLRPFLARSWRGQPVAVLVRPDWPVGAAGPVRRPFHHAAQRVTLGTSAGPLLVIGTHLQPYSGSWRLREAGWLAAALRRRPLALLAGDLNTLDPWSAHAGRLARLDAAYRRRHLRRDGTVDSRAVARLAGTGLVDLFRAVGSGDGHTAPTTGVRGPEFAAMRLDYLLASPDLARYARGCTVLRGGDAETASDHYPLLAQFELTPGTLPDHGGS